MSEEPTFLQVIAVVVLLGFFIMLGMALMISLDPSKCVYKASGEFTGKLAALNNSVAKFKGELSGEMYCRDVSKLVADASYEPAESIVGKRLM